MKGEGSSKSKKKGGEMAGTTSSEASGTRPEMNKTLKRNSADVGWDYAELVNPQNMDKLKCRLCGKITSGGIYRMKQHIANIKGNVASCKKSSDEDKSKCKNAIEEAKSKKRQKNAYELVLKEEVTQEEEYHDGSLGTRKILHTLGPLDQFASAIDPISSLSISMKTKQQQNIIDALWKERTHGVHQYLARWVYESGVPFHAIDNDSFKKFVEAVGQFGSGYCPASQYLLKEPLLKEEVDRTKSLLKNQVEERAINGCSILIDGWTNRKSSVMNLCVNCKKGTTFLSSKEASDEAHNGSCIFEYVDKCIEEVGPQNVVQVVTDNDLNNMVAKDLLKAKRPRIFWSLCATHTVNLMLQEIVSLPKFKGVIEKAKAFTIFIYGHQKTLSLMRKFTKKRDIVRPGVTRFATAFLTLQNLIVKKSELKAMVTSDEWAKCKHSKNAKGKTAYSTAMSPSFWNGVSFCLKVLAPLVKLLRLVDRDKRPSMGFVYGELLRAREEIKLVFNDQDFHYRPIIDIIDEKGRDRFDSPLHLTAYLLNPYYTYNDPSIAMNKVVMDGFFTFLETFFIDNVDIQSDIVNGEFLKYKNKEGYFGKALAKMGCSKNGETYDPVEWWNLYGSGVPKLQKIATIILSLTTSSWGCERNCSTFEGIHSKKRNKLDAKMVNNLVYVQFNARIINKKRRQEEKRDVLLASEATMAQGWIADGGDEDDEPNIENIRELHEEEFLSDEEEEEAMDFEFESDTEEVLEIYGDEQEEELVP